MKSCRNSLTKSNMVLYASFIFRKRCEGYFLRVCIPSSCGVQYTSHIFVRNILNDIKHTYKMQSPTHSHAHK